MAKLWPQETLSGAEIIRRFTLVAAAVSVIPAPTWTCPHCSFVHRRADLLRTAWGMLQCKGCGKEFDSVAEGYRKGEEGEQKMQR